ncbi:tetratricopeptide repeat-containing response regulator [Marinobacter apostichopi]|uniref:tetratricopeptide repeat-containing response regulator n=1 Tax=Marinobacter apostichopi TaxID=3035454 RepID=UPI002572A037|nr:tetratricopeptide repeat-containing response regulator [Marinobacter sp. LA51]
MSESSYQADAFHKLTYLVIDDFENFRLSLRQMLRACGADQIELVGNAKQAIKYCTYNHVDVVLCDYNLGEGKNGQHVLEELRHKNLLRRSSLFLMVTAETSKQMVMGARENQPDGYLTKPINRAMLEQRLITLLDQRKALLPINREIDRENYPEAISLCLQALPRNPRHKTWLLKTLGDLYFRLGDLSHAAKVFDDVLQQRELSWARLGRSQVLLANRSHDQAVANLKQLIDTHPDYMEAYDLLADGLRQQGKLSEAQQVLEQAIVQSPNALLRQKQLAEVAEANQDIDAAADAWRRTVSLGTHSIHDSADHYLALGQSLSELGEDEDNAEAVEHATEALEILGSMEKRFADQPTVGLRSRIVQCRVLFGQGQHREAEALHNSLKAEFDSNPLIDPDTSLDYAKTLFRVGRDGDARDLLGRLAEQHSDETELLKRIEALLDEPVGFRQKLKARNLTRDGIKAFEAGDLTAAAAAFTEALVVVPNHTSLNLNLVQVLLKIYEADPTSREPLEQCRARLDRLQGLPEQHRQHRRYIALSQKLKGLTA